MRIRSSIIAMILAGCVAGVACVSAPYQPAYSRPTMVAAVPTGAEGEPFYEDLVPYGRWVYVSGPGWVWSPYDAPAGWRPYQLGHWVFTDYGWTWASDETYGWAVYHYGRWHNDPAYGWVWVPGIEWGPAWVAWHEGDGWVGWAPLPWQVRWQAGIGLDWGGLSVNVALRPSSWHFVQARDMMDPGLRSHIAPPSRNVTLIRITRNVTNYTFIDNRIVNQSVKVETIGRAVGHTIPRYRVRETDSREVARGGKVRGGEFVVFRPNAVRGARSQGRRMPPDIDERRHPGDRPEQTLQDPPARQRARPEVATSEGESAPATGKTEPRPSRHPHPPARREAPAGARPAQPAAPEQGAGPAAPPATRPDGPAPGGPRDRVAPPDRPGSANAKPSRPGQTKTQQPAKSKEKKRGAKPGASDSEGSDSDKPKKEKSDSGN